MKIHESNNAVATWLEMKLLSALQNTNTQAENSTITLAARNSEDQIVGGLVASTSYGWLLVKILWVDNEHQRSGIGRSLMKQVESSALARGCHSAWLDTSSADARKFYFALGYEIFGELQNHDEQWPPGHHRWFMRKALSSETTCLHG